MLVVSLLDFLLGHADVAAHFLADHPLRDDAVLHVLFELFEGDALRLGGLLQVFHGLGVHLLAQLIEPLDHFGVGVDAELFALLQQQLLVDQVAQQVLLAVFFLRRSGVRFLLMHVGKQLLAGALQVGAGDDVVVDAGNDLFDHRVVLGQKQGNADESSCTKGQKNSSSKT